MMFYAQMILDICIVLAFIIAFSIIVAHINIKLPIANKSHIQTKNKYAILIPARNESKVIKNILESIKNQTYELDMSDTYVIVESLDDPTVEICKSYGASFFVRTNLDGRRRKGYALDECIKDIFSKGKKYDAYFIFDADNILDKDYILKMNESFNEGYDMAIGYRNSTNWNKNTVAACSALTFTMINEFGNKRRLIDGTNVIISGTGYYIKSYILEELGGFPFNELTEDYEISMYARFKNYKTSYNIEAVYFDEQPESLKVSNTQRLRWVKGYFEVRKKNREMVKKATKNENFKKKFDDAGIVPYLFLIIIFVGYLVASLVLDIKRGIGWAYPERFLSLCLFLYLLLVFFSLSLLMTEKKRAKISGKTIFKAMLFNPFFLMAYLPIAFKAITHKEIGWTEIKHTGGKK